MFGKRRRGGVEIVGEVYQREDGEGPLDVLTDEATAARAKSLVWDSGMGSNLHLLEVDWRPLQRELQRYKGRRVRVWVWPEQ